MKTISREWIKKNVLPKIDSVIMPDSFVLTSILEKIDISKELNDFLNRCQNEDGGFKAWIEPDIQSESSTIIATSVAMKFYYHLGKIDQDVKEKLTAYLNNTFNQEEKRWNIVSNDISSDPHAFWWNEEHESSFGYVNPSASILACAIVLGIELSHEIVEVLEQNIAELKVMDNIHDYACLDVYYQLSDKPYPDFVLDGAEKLISTDINEWHTYVPKPLDVITSKKHPLYHKYRDEVDLHLDYLIDQLSTDAVISTTWQWDQFEEYFESAQRMWEVRLTKNAIEFLEEFARLK
jgi:hypothetical protein